MKKTLWLAFSLALFFGFVTSTVFADSFRVGNPQIVASGTGAPGGSLANGAYAVAATLPTPVGNTLFGGLNPCGQDSATGPNCDRSWTFTNTSYASIASASITVGLIGLDSSDTGNQVGALLLNGTEYGLTAAFNTLAEAVQSNRATCVSQGQQVNNCPQYNIYQINIVDSGALAALLSGSTTFRFQSTGPGKNAFGNTTFNGVTLDFSELDITGQASVPEPSSLVLLLSGGTAALAAARRKLRR